MGCAMKNLNPAVKESLTAQSSDHIANAGKMVAEPVQEHESREDIAAKEMFEGFSKAWAAPVKQEPVAWMWKMHGWVVTAHGKYQAIKSYVDVCQPPLETQASDDFIELVPLYAAPVSAKREWVELTDDEIYDALAEVRFVRDNLLDGCRALIAALKEKNK